MERATYLLLAYFLAGLGNDFNFMKGKILCKLCKTELEIDQWFDHLVNAPYHGLHTNQHHLILNLYYYGQLNAKESYKEVPRVNPKSRFLLRLSNFYRKLSEFILLGSPDHPVGEMNLFQNFIFQLSSLEIQLRKCRYKLILRPGIYGPLGPRITQSKLV